MINTFFALVADDRPVREVHVFEAAIDAMSYASLKIMYHKDCRKIAYLSLAGVFASKRANVVPVALEQFLKRPLADYEGGSASG